MIKNKKVKVYRVDYDGTNYVHYDTIIYTLISKKLIDDMLPKEIESIALSNPHIFELIRIYIHASINSTLVNWSCLQTIIN